MAGGEAKNPFLLEEYKSRINRVLDYIEAHADKDFSLEELAGVAHFSKFHFHRLFYSLVGETLFQFIQRIRLERAAAMLVANPKKTITEIALDCGFADSAVFARNFKRQFGMSASQWRICKSGLKSNTGITESNTGQTNRNAGKADYTKPLYGRGIYTIHTRREIMIQGKVEVKEMPALTVAYVRHIGPYKGNLELFKGLFGKLMAWAGPRDLVRFPGTKSLIVYHDNPEITDENKLRVSVCITVPAHTKVDGEIGKMEIPAGKYAFVRFEIGAHEFQDAWDWVYGSWLPESGFQPDDGPCFELYQNDKDSHAEGKFIVDICLPVKPL